MHHTARTILFLAASILTTAIFAADPVATASARPVFTTTLTQSCGATIVREHAFDPNEGFAEIAALEKLNSELEALLRRGQLTTQMWEEMGLISFPSKEELFEDVLATFPLDEQKKSWLKGELRENRIAVVSRNRKRNEETGVDDVKDSIRVEPYKQINFRAARTGIYLHERSLTDFDKRGFDATMLALPGIGFFGSKAASMVIPSNVFVKGSDAALPTIPHKNNKRLKVLMIPVDTSLNGMQANAPFAFASPRGVLAVTRHVDLYVRTRFPGLPRFQLGRSQGGLNVLESSLYHSDVATIAMNPSFPADDVILHSIYKYEHQGPKSGLSSMADVVHRAWEAHHAYTRQFEALRTGRGNLSPSLVILGDGDPSYPDYYSGRVQSWANLQPDLRGVQRLSIPSDERDFKPTVVHTLLLYDCKKTFDMTVNTIGQFIVNHLEEMERRQREWFEQPLE